MDSEPQIRILPDHVANKIAAGEVVDRPASVLKELIENALDAGATHISVEVSAGGKKAVIVSDNGHGMSRDNALLSIERHATSKIRDADDLERVNTLGFRGEALAAIAAVSRMTLTTRRTNALSGTEIVIVGGTIQDAREVGCPPGTTVAVRNLFFNVPARRKFLRSEQTEDAHLRQIFTTYAISHPRIGFRLIVDRKEVQRLPADATLQERLITLLGAEVFRCLKPVEHSGGGISITGFAGLPDLGRADRSEQYVFVNGRPASASVLSFAISEAYRTLLLKGRYATVYLFIDVDPAAVDVNVHPAKKEVRFRRANEVRDQVIAALRKTLEVSSVAIPNANLELPTVNTLSAPPTPTLQIEGLPPPRTFSYPRLPMGPVAPQSLPPQNVSGSASVAGASAPAGTGSPWSWCRVLGQVGGLFVVMETEDGLVLMDPHAAHERVLYEKYMNERQTGKVVSQGLLTPETVELLPRQAERVRENLALLREMGFGLSEFGRDTFLVDAMPACLGAVSPRDLLIEAAAELDQAGVRGGSERLVEERVAQAACKAAVKARDRLRIEEIEQLVVDLSRTAMPYTCPHGRPTVIFMGYEELHRKFGRT